MTKVVAAVFLILLSPLFAGIALLVWLTDRQSPFYIARRVGLGGGTFAMVKFRTMRPGKSKAATSNAGAITAVGDSRITPIGRFLRNTKLDELPQLLNILRGDMAFFGPRPEDPGIVARYYDDEMRKSLLFVPGLLSPGTLWALRHLHRIDGAADTDEVYARKILPERLSRDTAYFEQAGIISHLELAMNTMAVLLHRAVSARHRE
ncbi:sugar transferase [Stappia sp. BW2]|uniref:sugar transferase n=1 Tax=Stappia sp. BW2 TaxID=2592622 RepID=UPI0011DE90AB|nr:sugar transferase [Stappia sp. BW2]TYC64674.1 sugar transferase [Stappia sp. BW2]